MATEYLNNKKFEVIIAEFQQSKRDKDRLSMIIEDQKGAIGRKKKRKSNARANWKLLNQLKKEHAQSVIDHEQSKNDLATAFYLLSANIVRYAKFQLIDEDDALQEGVVICFEKVDRFFPKKGRAFNYMTTCILNHFRQLYRSARNYNELKKRYHDFQQLQFNKMIIHQGKEIPVYRNSLSY